MDQSLEYLHIAIMSAEIIIVPFQYDDDDL